MTQKGESHMIWKSSFRLRARVRYAILGSKTNVQANDQGIKFGLRWGLGQELALSNFVGSPVLIGIIVPPVIYLH